MSQTLKAVVNSFPSRKSKTRKQFCIGGRHDRCVMPVLMIGKTTAALAPLRFVNQLVPIVLVQWR
jgi:hypothetical protein